VISANFKVPTRIILVAAIPKGPTGKPQRIGLADRLVKEMAVSFETPVSETERLIAGIFEDVLQHVPVGRKDNFFALGGDSLVAMRAHNRLSETFGISVSPTLLFRRPTISELAGEVDRLMEEREVEFLAREMENLPREEAFRLLDDDDIHG
jgi:oxalate---CoA ligase